MRLKIFFLFFFVISLFKLVYSSISIDSLENIIKSNIEVYQKSTIILDNLTGELKDSLNKMELFGETLLEESINSKDLKAEATAYCILAEPWFLRFNYQEAIEYYKKAEKLYRYKKSKEIAYVYKNLGICYSYIDENEMALENFIKTLKLYKKYDEVVQVAILKQNIGDLYRKWDKNEIAMKYFNEAYEIFDDKNDTARLAVLYINIADNYNDMKAYELAIETYHKSLSLFTNLGDKLPVANNCLSLGLIYDIYRDFDLALSYYQKALMIYEEVGDLDGTIIALSNIGASYHNMAFFSNNPKSWAYDKALEYYNAGLEKALANNNLYMIIQIYDGIHNTLEEQGRFKKSLKYFKKYIALKDSFNNEKKYALALELEEKLQRESRTIEQDYEDKIDVIRKNNKLRLRILLIMNVVSLLFLSFMVYKYFELKGKMPK